MSTTTLKTTPADGDKSVIGTIEYIYSDANKRWESTGLPVSSLSTTPLSDQTVIAARTTVTPLILKGALGQTANVFEVEDTTGKSLFNIGPSGVATFSSDINFAGHINGVIESDPKTKTQRIAQTVPTASPLIIESMAGSTVNALAFTNGGTVNASVDKDGAFSGTKLSINTPTTSHVLNIGCSGNGTPYAINIDAGTRTAGEGSHEFITFTGVGTLGTVFSVDGNGLIVSKKIKADAGSIHTLTSNTGTIGTLHSTTGTIATLKSTNATLTSATIPTLHSTTGTIATLNSTTATLTKATIPTLISTTGTIATLNSTTLKATSGTVDTLKSTTATLTKATIPTLLATTGTVTTLTSTKGTIATLGSTTGTIATLNSTNGTIATLHSTTGTITNLHTTTATIGNGTVTGKLSQRTTPAAAYDVTNKAYVDAQDKLHLKKTTDTFTGTLTVTGTIKASGDIWAYNTSDRRVKADIEDMPDDSLERNKIMSGKTFIRTDRDDDNRRYAGLIAQDIQKAIPEAIEEGDDGILRYDETSVIAHLVDCVNALTNENTHIKSRMEMLEEKLDSLINQG